ncbi:hypothetical protein [Flavobacterium sp.]|uniref:hypothetical protein n=1 Tax=Flavobacterium sp. TaxID=239 RepID=UPI00374CE858
MSELNSFFAKIHITKDNFDSFLNSKPKMPTLNSDWLEWWNLKEMYNNEDLQEGNLYCYEGSTNESIINDWLESKQSLAFSDYDIKNEIWHFGIIMFAENYLEMIPGLAFIKSVAEFKTENKDDFAIVYSYLWGEEEIDAYIKFENKDSFFDVEVISKDDINAIFMKYTDSYLDKKMEDLTQVD